MSSATCFDALYESLMKCKKGVMWKDSTAAMVLRGVERIAKLSRDLINNNYKPNPTKIFKVTSPKPREIASISFRDRVYQRSLNDNAVYPAMTRSFIYDNFACQIGKGTDAARERLKEFLRKYYMKNGYSGYVARFDIKGYYPNMRHDIVEQVFKKRLNSSVYEQVKKILRNQYDGEVGYNPGSQLVQIAGISVLNDMDHYIKEKLHIKYYLRYMDDFIIIHDSYATLKDSQEKIRQFVSKYGFDFNEKKTVIKPVQESIPFLGFDFRLTSTGKVLMILRSENVKREKRKLKRMVSLSKRDGITKKSVDDSFESWKAHASKGNSYELIRRMDIYYKNLWDGNKK